MKRAEGADLEKIRSFFGAAATEATHASCLRAHCGSVIVSEDGEIIGRGFNAPPLGDESRRTCNDVWDYEKKPKYDLTCCVHAEWNAAINALKTNPSKIGGSTLYFMRPDERANFTDAGEPYCTTCSRLIMQTGVAYFALWNDGGADIYTLAEYDTASYAYFRKQSA